MATVAFQSIAGSGSTRTVMLALGPGDGSVGLNLTDNDSIHDTAGNPLGGPGATGDMTGPIYTIDRAGPDSRLVSPAGVLAQLDPVVNLDTGARNWRKYL